MLNNRFLAKVKYLTLIVCSIFTLSLMNLTGTTSAQSATAIDFAKPVKGEITDSQFAIDYTFSAKANDTVVITMERDYAADLSDELNPQLILLDSQSKHLADTSTQTYSDANLAVQLAADGTYTITATREKGKAGDTKGKFVLVVYKAAVLTTGTPIKDKIKSSAFKFYMYTSGDPFTLAYVKAGGDFTPDIDVFHIDKNALDTLESDATLSGKALTGGTLTLTPDDKTLFVIRIGASLTDFSASFNELTANYSLSISPAS